MGLEKSLKGRGNSDVAYHMIPNGTLEKNLLSGAYKVSFNLVSFYDQDTRDNMPAEGYLDVRSYVKDITDPQMAHIIDYLGLYDHVKNNQSDKDEGLVFSDALDVD